MACLLTTCQVPVTTQLLWLFLETQLTYILYVIVLLFIIMKVLRSIASSTLSFYFSYTLETVDVQGVPTV